MTMMNSMQQMKIVANSYKLLRPLFQIKSYLYAQVCQIKNNYEVKNYVYENEEPAQSLKMLKQKLAFNNSNQLVNLIFPIHHVKDEFSQKSISLFFFNDYPIPMKFYQKFDFTNQQYLQILHGGLSCLNQLHMRQIVHGNISISTSYFIKQKEQNNTKFALNILDTSYFTQQEYYQGIQQRLFQSQAQGIGLKVSYKDDLESLIYVIVHLISKGKVFTVQRYQLQWVTQTQFLRWKTCQFFKQMIHIIPPQLQILKEIYTIAKSLRRTQKPDYLKLIKKVIFNTVSLNQKQTKKTLKKTMKNSNLLQKSRNRASRNDSGIRNSILVTQIKKQDIQVTIQDKPAKKARTSIQKQNKQFQII